MEIRSLKTLVAVADHGSFAAAGAAVGLSQSAVSLQMKGLETSLGRVLFDRSHRPPLLNAEGRALVDRAREVVALWNGLTEGIRAEPQAGSLALGAIPTLVSGILPESLRRLRAENPRLKLRLTTGLSNELEQLVLKEQLDVALVTQPEALTPGLSWHPFQREPLVVIAPADQVGPDDRSTLEAAPYIRFRRHAWAGQLIDGELSRRGIAVKPQMEVDSLEGIARLVASGLGVSVIPDRQLLEPFPKGLVSLPFGDPQVHRTLGLIERRDHPKARLAAQLYDALKATAGGR